MSNERLGTADTLIPTLHAQTLVTARELSDCDKKVRHYGYSPDACNLQIRTTRGKRSYISTATLSIEQAKDLRDALSAWVEAKEAGL